LARFEVIDKNKFENQFYPPPVTVPLQEHASVSLKQETYDYDIPIVRQLRFARRLPAALHPVHRRSFPPLLFSLSRNPYRLVFSLHVVIQGSFPLGSRPHILKEIRRLYPLPGFTIQIKGPAPIPQ
jgi:hypothetical protein